MPKAIKVINKRKSSPGRKSYEDEKEFAVPVQFYKKSGDVEKLGGMEKVRELMSNCFDSWLSKIR